ncbi:MAG: hypothetical protein BWX70_02201 [Verrucomicrobia bacterium ADurb.Bin070]|nr:MAG: hypothetical protein BWX70_02201 [Verrucomicrobia bacterium ADurb.Bin070]
MRDDAGAAVAHVRGVVTPIPRDGQVIVGPILHHVGDVPVEVVVGVLRNGVGHRRAGDLRRHGRVDHRLHVEDAHLRRHEVVAVETGCARSRDHRRRDREAGAGRDVGAVLDVGDVDFLLFGAADDAGREDHLVLIQQQRAVRGRVRRRDRQLHGHRLGVLRGELHHDVVFFAGIGRLKDRTRRRQDRNRGRGADKHGEFHVFGEAAVLVLRAHNDGIGARRREGMVDRAGGKTGAVGHGVHDEIARPVAEIPRHLDRHEIGVHIRHLDRKGLGHIGRHRDIVGDQADTLVENARDGGRRIDDLDPATRARREEGVGRRVGDDRREGEAGQAAEVGAVQDAELQSGRVGLGLIDRDRAQRVEDHVALVGGLDHQPDIDVGGIVSRQPERDRTDTVGFIIARQREHRLDERGRQRGGDPHREGYRGRDAAVLVACVDRDGVVACILIHVVDRAGGADLRELRGGVAEVPDVGHARRLVGGDILDQPLEGDVLQRVGVLGRAVHRQRELRRGVQDLDLGRVGRVVEVVAGCCVEDHGGDHDARHDARLGRAVSGGKGDHRRFGGVGGNHDRLGRGVEHDVATGGRDVQTHGDVLRVGLGKRDPQRVDRLVGFGQSHVAERVGHQRIVEGDADRRRRRGSHGDQLGDVVRHAGRHGWCGTQINERLPLSLAVDAEGSAALALQDGKRGRRLPRLLLHDLCDVGVARPDIEGDVVGNRLPGRGLHQTVQQRCRLLDRPVLALEIDRLEAHVGLGKGRIRVDGRRHEAPHGIAAVAHVADHPDVVVQELIGRPDRRRAGIPVQQHRQRQVAGPHRVGEFEIGLVLADRRQARQSGVGVPVAGLHPHHQRIEDIGNQRVARPQIDLFKIARQIEQAQAESHRFTGRLDRRLIFGVPLREFENALDIAVVLRRDGHPRHQQSAGRKREGQLSQYVFHAAHIHSYSPVLSVKYGSPAHAGPTASASARPAPPGPPPPP